MTMNDREEFEKLFPVPLGVKWCERQQDYTYENYRALDSAVSYSGKWQAWQAARAQGGGEPVAWRVSHPEKAWVVYDEYPDWAEGYYEIEPLYTQPRSTQQESLPEVCDGKEQEAFEVYASRKGYDMAQHPMHYLFINDKTNAARQAWKAAISYCHEKMYTSQPEADGRVRRDEPFGTESAYQEAKDRPMGSNMNISCALFSELVDEFRRLKRPQPPAGQEGV